MTDGEVQQLVAEEFASIATVLQEGEPTAWDAPSLCSEWSVREVVAHVTAPARLTDEEFRARLLDNGVDFDEAADAIARADGRLSPESLLRDLRGGRMAGWAPPWGGPRDALNHALIHGLDITVALGLPRTAGPDALRVVLSDLVSGEIGKSLGVDTTGKQYVVTDLEQTLGDGDELVSGSSAELILTLTGRRLPARGVLT